MKNTLITICARGGSKGIPGKNIKPLHGKPLIAYTIDVARALTDDEHICVSTDDDNIIETAQKMGLNIPFKRPPELATDEIGTYPVLLHAVNFYEQLGRNYDRLILLQPTSPFRTASQVKEALQLYNKKIDMVVSVKEASTNPYYNGFEENENGFLELSKKTLNYVRRQDAPQVWEYNGAIYIININSLKKNPLNKFTKIVKYEMDPISSVDLDTPLDWKFAEFLMNEKMVKLL